MKLLMPLFSGRSRRRPPSVTARSATSGVAWCSLTSRRTPFSSVRVWTAGRRAARARPAGRITGGVAASGAVSCSAFGRWRGGIGADQHRDHVLRPEVGGGDALDVLARGGGELGEVATLVVRILEDALRVAEQPGLSLHRLLAVDELALEVAAGARQLGARDQLGAGAGERAEQLGGGGGDLGALERGQEDEDAGILRRVGEGRDRVDQLLLRFEQRH